MWYWGGLDNGSAAPMGWATGRRPGAGGGGGGGARVGEGRRVGWGGVGGGGGGGLGAGANHWGRTRLFTAVGPANPEQDSRWRFFPELRAAPLH